MSLVLLDISMPGMDGYEVLQQIKADERTADVGVIFITGQTDEADEERGLLLGATDYVSKPIRPAIVRARILAHLKLATQRRELERLSTQDGLTGIANRRHFDDAFERACRHAARRGEPISVACSMWIISNNTTTSTAMGQVTRPCARWPVSCPVV